MQQELKFVTCSGANEFTDIDRMISLSKKFPLVEWGLQVSGKKCSQETPRWDWIHSIHQSLQAQKKAINLALHVNADWVEEFCIDRVSPELNTLLRMRDVTGSPFFRRVQLNFKIGREKTPIEKLLMMRIQEYGQRRRFILSYNEENREFIHLLYRKGLRNFDILYDASHGEGVSATEWKEPVFYDTCVLQGYAGGLSVDNVIKEVINIRRKLPYNGSFYIDAEGKLKGDDKHLSLDKCEEYIQNALSAMMFQLSKQG